MLDALEIGLSEEQFGEMCIRQLFRHFVVAKRKVLREHNRDVSLAWWITAMELASHSKDGKKRKVPDLKKYLAKDPAEQVKTPAQKHAELKGALYMLAGQFGGRVRQVQPNG